MPHSRSAPIGFTVMIRTDLKERMVILGALTVIIACLCPQVALADAADTINFTAGVTQQRDSNIFRLADGVDPRPLVGNSARADTMTTGTFGARVRKAYSLQQFEGDLSRVSSRYDTYTHLNNEADNARAVWRWQATPHLTGNLTFNRTQFPIGFADYANYSTQNMRTITTQRLDADWNPFRNGWHLRGGVERTKTHNSRAFVQDEGTSIVGADLGVRLVFPSANWVELITLGRNGTYLGRSLDTANQRDTGFRNRRTELRARWMGGKSVVEGSVGYASRNHDHFSNRNHSGAVGSISWTWAPASTLALVTMWKRDLVSYLDAISSYYRQDVISIGPVWQASAKLKLSVKFDHTRRDFRGAVTSLPFIARQDRSNSMQIGAEWTPLRALTLGAHYIENKRDSSLPFGDFAARTVGFSLRFDF